MIEDHRCGYNTSNYHDFSNAPKLLPEFLRFGYVVRVETEKRDALYGMVVFTGDFNKKVYFEDRRMLPSLQPLDKVIDKIDIVYGYDSEYAPFRLSAISRPVLWRKK